MDWTMRALSVHFAFFGASGMSCRHDTLFGTTELKPIHLPSGAQRISAGPSVSVVTCVVAPSESIHLTKICVPDGLPSARYAMRVPSGDHTAFPPVVRKRFFEPSAFMIQSEDSNR